MNVLVTGASGFLGSHLCSALQRDQHITLTACVRKGSSAAVGRAVEISSIDSATDWKFALEGQDVVIHTAARAHFMKDKVVDPLEEYRKVNVEGTLNLARQAFSAGAKRFVFISSIKVNGEATSVNRPYKSGDTPAPEDAYGVSKFEAEQSLRKLAIETSKEVVIIRPPLVYGPGVKGNFASMISLVAKGLPLPLGAVKNQRSLVALDNLVDLIITCIDHPAAANEVFLAGDGQDLSTTELLQGVARAIGKPPRLIPVPASFLMLGATLLGRKAVAQRLLGSLQVDISKACDLLGWEPPISVEEGLRRCFQSQDT